MYFLITVDFDLPKLCEFLPGTRRGNLKNYEGIFDEDP